MGDMQGTSGRAALIAVLATVAVTAFFTVASYPGFMSFDSLEALRQARFQVEGSQYPPFGSYVWRMLDWVWPGPTLMQLFQNALLFASFAWILHRLRVHPLVQLAAPIALAALPPVTGTMLVVWKDVAVAAFYLAGFATTFHVRQGSNYKKSLLALAVFLIFCGMAYRFNAASGALPLLVYVAWIALDGNGPRGAARAIALGATLLFVLFALVWAVNSFRFPSLERLERNTNLDSIMQFDLVGISRYSGESAVPDRNGELVDPAYLRKIYDPRHLNITAANDVEQRIAQQQSAAIRHAWLAAVAKHPLAYLLHRGRVFREYIGLHGHEIFYVTHPSVDENKLGVTHTPNRLTRIAVGYVWDARSSLLERPWVYYALAMVSFALVIFRRSKRFRIEAMVMLASSLLYLAPMYFITPAADLRYNFWSIVAAVVSFAFAAASLLRAPSYEPPM